MNIGFDLDKVLIDYPPFVPAKLIDKLYKKSGNGKLLYRFPSKPEQLLRKISHYHLFRPVIRNHLDFIKNLTAKNNHRYFLISSRFSFLKEETRFIVKKNGLDKLFNQLFFNFNDQQPHLFKNEIIKKNNIHRYVDDDLSLIKYVSKKNQKTLFYWLNSSFSKPLSKNVFAIKNLSEMKL